MDSLRQIHSIQSSKDMEYERIKVECRSGYKANEYPIAFTFQERRWKVLEILDRWYEGGLEANRPKIETVK